MDYRIFNVRTDVCACNCARGCADTVRECALKVDSGKKISCRTRESNLHWWLAGPVLYQLSYIPTPCVMPCKRTQTLSVPVHALNRSDQAVTFEHHIIWHVDVISFP